MSALWVRILGWLEDRFPELGDFDFGNEDDDK